MTYSLAAATVHGGGFPAPLTVLVVVAAVAYVLWSRMKGQPLKARRLLVLPVVLTVLGITDLTSSGAPHLSSADIAFLVVSVTISAVLGAARGATIELYPNQGELWQRYRRSTVGLWVALIATKLVIAVIASAAGASAGGGTNSLLLTLGVSLLAEAAVVAPRALSTGLPFPSGTKTSAHNQPDHDLASPTRPRLAQPSPAQPCPGRTGPARRCPAQVGPAPLSPAARSPTAMSTPPRSKNRPRPTGWAPRWTSRPGLGQTTKKPRPHGGRRA